MDLPERCYLPCAFPFAADIVLFEVIDEFLFQLLMGLFANPSRFDRGG